MALHAGWPSALLAFLLGATPTLGQEAQPSAAPAPAAQDAPDACAASASYVGCTGGCEPGKLIFLPCMAVGATNMAGCRQREVASCLRACASRHCS
jgi:hypothetical protein